MPLPDSRDPLFDGAHAAAALVAAAAAAAAPAGAGADAAAAAIALVTRLGLPPSVGRSIAATLPTRPVFHGIGSTSACVSGGPSAPTFRARLTPAC
jgi:hypothetical protein